MRRILLAAVVLVLAGVGWPAKQALTARTTPQINNAAEAGIRLTRFAVPPRVPTQRFTSVELECLALNIYHEARGEPPEGQLAVAQVVLNRASDRRFPNHVCDVVKDGGEEMRYRCQFSWWCDGRSDKPSDFAAWQQSRRAASAALSGHATDPTFGALWYHADYVRPGWAETMTRMTSIGSHIFYLD